MVVVESWESYKTHLFKTLIITYLRDSIFDLFTDYSHIFF